MTRYLAISEAERPALEIALEAVEPPSAPSYVHPSIAHLVPKSWDGQGEPPLGWSRGFGISRREDGSLYVVATAELAAKTALLAAAVDALPADDTPSVDLPVDPMRKDRP